MTSDNAAKAEVDACPSPELKQPTIAYSIFSRCQRIAIISLVTAAGLVSPLSGQLFTPALPTIAVDLGVSISAVNITITTYLIAQGFSPTIWGSLGDNFGRRLLYITTLVVYIGACLGLSVTNSYAVVLALRVMQGAGSAVSIALGAGVVSDIADSSERGGVMGFYSAGIAIGTAFGPMLGGIFAQYAGWHSIFYFLVALAAVLLTVVILLLPETLRSIVGNGSYPPPRYLQPPIRWLSPSVTSVNSIDTNRPPKRKLDMLGSLRIIMQPDSFCVLLFAGINYSVWQMTMVSASTLYYREYNLNEVSIGLTYLANGFAALLGSLATGKILDLDYQKELARENKKSGQSQTAVVRIERARLRSLPYPIFVFIASVIGFGWVIESKTHISVSIVLAFFIGWCTTGVMSATSTLMVDMFPGQSSSATASMNLMRCWLGAAAVSAIEPMIQRIGAGWSFTLLGGICLLSIPLLLAEVKYGQKWKANRQKKAQAVSATVESSEK